MSLQYRSTSSNKEKVGIIFSMHVSLHGLTSYKSSWIILNPRSISMWRNRYTDRRYPRRHLRLYFMFSLHLPVTESMQIANITGLTDEGTINVYILSQIRAFSNRWMNDSYYTVSGMISGKSIFQMYIIWHFKHHRASAIYLHPI